MVTPTLHPFDRTAGTDLKALGRLTSRRSRLHCFDNSLTQVTDSDFGIVLAPPVFFAVSTGSVPSSVLMCSYTPMTTSKLILKHLCSKSETTRTFAVARSRLNS
jgi:hypothetical protein